MEDKRKGRPTPTREHIKVVVSGARDRSGRDDLAFRDRIDALKTKYPDLAQMLIDFCDVSFHDPCDTCDTCDIA
jgi:hypothetical protein